MRPSQAADTERPLAEQELTALWLLGRVPPAVLPLPLLRAGRQGRGPGPDVREATLLFERVPRCGDVEVHLRASDFVSHGHLEDPAYGGVVLHLVWEDDRGPERGSPQALPGNGAAPTVEVGRVLGWRPERVRRLLQQGPTGGEPCAGLAERLGAEVSVALVRAEGRKRLAERAWRAAELATARGWDGAWRMLLEHALRRSAGRHAESPGARSDLAERISVSVGWPLEVQLARLARDRAALLEAMRGEGALGPGRASEIGWNAVLPFLIALAAAYEDPELARATARLAAEWPAPAPYGRTRALERSLLGVRRTQGGALWAQGLLHLQDLWCTRGGCGACPLSTGDGAAAALIAASAPAPS